MSLYGGQLCCWCGKSQNNDNFNGAVSEEETNVTLLLELLGVSSSLLNEDIVYRMCNDCAELVSYGTDLKVQTELENDLASEESCRRQLEKLEKDLKSRAVNYRAHNVLCEPTENNNLVPVLGFHLAKCFEECHVKLRPEDNVSLEQLLCDDDIRCTENSPENSDCASDCTYTPSDEEKSEIGTRRSVKSSSPPSQRRSGNVPVRNDFECCGCTEVFTNAEDRFRHERKHRIVRNGRDFYKCDECDRVVRSPYHLKSHRQSHKRFFQCEVCDKTYLNTDTLQGHRRKKHNLTVHLSCKFCSKKFWTQHSLTRHEATCANKGQLTASVSTPIANKNVSAVPGGKNISVSDDIIIKKEASLEDPPTTDPGIHECGGCFLMFATKSAMLKHEKTHEVLLADGRTVYKCGICGREASTHHNMKSHSKAHFKSPPTCGVCGKTYSRTATLRLHMNVHDPENVFKCEFCDAKFSTNGQLITHRRIHTGEKPYKCDYCSKAFARSDKLTIHRRQHTGEKPYECEHCKQRFARVDKLKLHLMVHTGEKPFVCDICGEKFRQNTLLTCHKKLRHRNAKCSEIPTSRNARRGRKPKRSLPKAWSDEDISESEPEDDQDQGVVELGLKMTLREKKQKRVFTKPSSDDDGSDLDDVPDKVPE